MPGVPHVAPDKVMATLTGASTGVQLGAPGGGLWRQGSMNLPAPEDSGVPPDNPDSCILRIRRNHLIEVRYLPLTEGLYERALAWPWRPLVLGWYLLRQQQLQADVRCCLLCGMLPSKTMACIPRMARALGMLQ